MRRFLTTGVFLGLTIAVPALAADLATLPTIDVVSSDDTGVRLECAFPDLSMDEVSLGGEVYVSLTIPGGGIVGEVGAPALPTFSRLVAIPDHAGVRVSVVPLEVEEIRDVALAPVTSGRPGELAIDDAAYASDRFDDLADATLGEPALLRDLRVVNLTFQPVHYNPAEKTLRVVRRMQVDVDFGGEDLRNVALVPARPIPPSFDRIYRELVLNYSDAARDEAVAAGSYVVICRNDAGVISRLQPLLDWRRRMGYPVVLATTSETGTTTTAIKSYLQTAYNTWETPPEFIVLAGDADGSYPVPTWFENISGYSGEGDHPYTTLAGGDILADAHIGRLSFANYSDLELIVEKILTYETNPTLDDPGWYSRACLVGDPSSSGQSTITVNQWLKERLRDLHYTEIDTIWSSPFVSQMTLALNKGGTVFNYRGYLGMSGWSNALSEALTNRAKMPFAVVITCDTGSFAGATSRTEGLLRAGVPGTPAGAIAAIGTSTIGTHTRYNNCMDYGIQRGLVEEGLFQTGVALTRGKLEVYLNYFKTEPARAETWAHWNNLMGDPAVDIYNAYPTALNVTHPAQIAFGANALEIVVEDGFGPLAGVRVCADKDGETHAVGYTDANGYVELPLTNTSIGDLLITATGHDKYPYLATVPVAAEPAYVGYLASTIDDDAAGTSSGNGDGIVNPAETIELPVQVRNFGINPATNVSADLTTTDPYVTILDGNESFGTVGGLTSVWSADDFDFQVAADCPHDHLIRFGLDVTSDTDAWHSLIEVPVVAPALSVLATAVQDGGNSHLDPGETVGLTATLKNLGGAAASDVVATLFSDTPFITVQDAAGTFGSIAVGGISSNIFDSFTVTASPATYQGYLAALRLALTYSSGVIDTVEFTVRVGTKTSVDPVGPDLYGYYAFDDTDTAYGDAPVYQWVEIDADLGGSGTKVTLGDYGSYQDKSKTVDVPFPFQYYGRLYDRATICSNGWVAMGNTYLTSYRNWTIPGAGGPDAMIAPFWDDLTEANGGEVYQWYDPETRRWIIEWSRMRCDYNGATETFEVIFYDPAYYPTATGDGKIVFQYQAVSISDPVDGYVTVGIENHDQNDGVLYTYFNQYTEGAAPVVANRAIAFVPSDDRAMGTLFGDVLNGSHGNDPLAGAEVLVVEEGRRFFTDDSGSYAGFVPAGSYTVVAQLAGFDPDTTYGVFIDEGQPVQADFLLSDNAGPILTTTPHPSTDDQIGPYLIPVTIEERSGIAEKLAFFRTNGGSFGSVVLQPIGGDEYLASIPGQPHTTLVEYYVYARDEVGFESYDPVNAPAELYSFFVAPFDELLADDFETDHGWTVGAAGDNATTGIWLRADPVGSIQDTFPVQPEDDHTTNPGTICFVTGNANPGDAAGTNDVDNGHTTLLSPVFDLEGFQLATVEYWLWYSNQHGNGAGEDPWIVEVTNDGSTWTPLENTTGNTGDQWAFRSFQLGDYIELTSQVQLRFIATDEGTGSLVEAAVDDFVLRGMNVSSAVGDDPTALRVGLDFARPNPANPTTHVSYRLAGSAQVDLALFDVGGRLVRTLVDGREDAGPHEVAWDGRDGAGRPMASGIYFLRFRTGDYLEVRQIALVR